MWHTAVLVLSAGIMMLLAIVGVVDATAAITADLEDKYNDNDKQTFMNSSQGPSKLSLGPHLAPKIFPVDNPFNLTEEQALQLGIKVIPVDNEHWDALVNKTGLNEPIDTNDNGNNLRVSRRQEINPPEPTDWCTPKDDDTSQCTFGAWCHSQSNKDVPNRAWVFFHDCELTGELHPWQWNSWMDIYSRLPWVTVFKVHASLGPHLKYAGRQWSNWAHGWELYYPYRSTRGIYYYRRYFDCS